MAIAAQTTGNIQELESPLNSRRKQISFALSILLLLAVWFSPLRFEPTAKHALAVAAFMILAWITECLPHAVTGLVGCFLFWTLGITSFGNAFAGFADQTAWFLFGAGLFAVMATKSGLGRRLAYLVLRKVGTSYSRLLLGMILTSFLLTFLVPSGIACVIILAAVALGLMEVFGLGRGSNIGRGLFITLTYTAGMFDKIVMAGASSLLARGLIQKAAGIEIYWSLWLLAFFPVAVVVIFFTWRLVLWLYPPESEALESGAAFLDNKLSEMGPWTREEKKALGLMLAAIAFWSTDLLHHISPAIIGIGIGLLATVPGLGVLDEGDLKRVNFLPVIFTGGAISMGSVLVETHALQTLTNIMFAWMRPFVLHSYSAALVPYWTAFFYHIFLGNELSMLATSIPPLVNFAKANGLGVLPMGFVWAFAAGGKIFVYQSGVMVTGYSFGYFEAKDLFRVGLCLTIVESLALLVLVPFYWPLIGIR